MRDTDGLQINLAIEPVNSLDSTLSVELRLQLTLPLPDQDARLPEKIEAGVHRAGLEVQRRLFGVLIEKADQQLVLSRRRGKAGAGIQRRGTRPFTFKTIFGEVTVRRSRISHKLDGSIETPSADAWQTPHQLAITANLRDAACDQMRDRSAGQSRSEIGRIAGDDDLLGRSTILEIVHREGRRLIAAQAQRAGSILDDASPAQLGLLGPRKADAAAQEPGDEPPCDEVDGPEQADPAATGFPGSAPAPPSGRHEPRDVDEGFVIVSPDEVKTRAQPSTGGKEVWAYTAMVLIAGWRYALVGATAEDLWSQVGAVLLESGVLCGERRLLVLGDGAGWIRAWFEGLGISPKAMILCWWHLRKRCYQSMSQAGGPKDRRQALEEELLGLLWEAKVDAAATLLKGSLDWVRTPRAVEDLIGYLERRRGMIPDYQERQRAGLWIASTRVEKWNDWAVSSRCKHRGMSWSPGGVLALATLEAARRNGELDRWREDAELPERIVPQSVPSAA